MLGALADDLVAVHRLLGEQCEYRRAGVALAPARRDLLLEHAARLLHADGVATCHAIGMDWVALMAALATSASAIVIAIQAKYTRRSAEASENAVAIANDTLREAQIARIDSNTPRFFVAAEGFLAGVATLESKARDDREVVGSDRVFRMPRDGDDLLALAYFIRIHNDGPGTLQLMCSDMFTIGGPDAEDYLDEEGQISPRILRQMTLAPGASQRGSFVVERRIADWVTIAEAVERGAPLDDWRFQLVARGTGDMDVDVAQSVVVTGSPLTRVPREDGAWRVANQLFEVIRGAAQPAVRTYWRSRMADERFV